MGKFVRGIRTVGTLIPQRVERHLPKRPVQVAIAYDFDGTLAPGNMQERDFIPAINTDSDSFWRKVKQLAKDQHGDEILAYMGHMLRRAKAEDISVRRANFQEFGRKLKLFPGLTDYSDKDGAHHAGWFDRINTYANESGLIVKHYVISSGIREMIEGSVIGRHFEKIYASSFQYDVDGVAIWPALSVNYTTKTQYLFRINKGSLDVYDNSIINAYVPDSERPVPFRNMIFVGDGDTDIPCFRLVREKGGHSLAVFQKRRKNSKDKPQRLMTEGRINYFAEADYREGSKLDRIVKALIDKVQIDSYLSSLGH